MLFVFVGVDGEGIVYDVEKNTKDLQGFRWVVCHPSDLHNNCIEYPIDDVDGRNDDYEGKNNICGTTPEGLEKL